MIVSMIICAIIFSPLTYLMSYRLRVKEDQRIKDGTLKEETGADVLHSIAKTHGRALGLRRFLVHNYEERKRSGELRKLRKAFEKTSNRLLKINIGEEDKKEMADLGLKVDENVMTVAKALFRTSSIDPRKKNDDILMSGFL